MLINFVSFRFCKKAFFYVFVIMLSTYVLADEGGVPFWMSGQYASLVAVPPESGWSLVVQGYYYDGKAPSGKSLSRGDSFEYGLSARVPIVLYRMSYVPEEKVLGGKLMLGYSYGYGWNTTSAEITLLPHGRGREFESSDSVSGSTDLYPIASLTWGSGVHNWMTYFTGDVPVGAYDPKHIANIGIGHGAIDAGGGYTYLDQQSGREFSAVFGLTYNLENTDTNYKNGVDSHLDFGVSQFLSANWQVGVVGYVYYQLTDDSGSGAMLGPFESRVAAVGPEIGYMFTIDGKPAYVNLRGYREFWGQRRLEGSTVFATFMISL